MISKDYTIPYWVIGAILLTCILPWIQSWWGVIASTITLFIVGFGAYFGISRWYRLKRPFSISRVGITSSPFPSPADFQNRKVGIGYFDEETIAETKCLCIDGVGEHIICVALSPKISLEIDEIGVRFVPEKRGGRPRVTGFNETWGHSFDNESDDNNLGRRGEYRPATSVNEGRNLYFIAKCEVYREWQGELSFKFYIKGQKARPARIPTRITV